jgi:DNA-binding NtrC family response regulator
VRQLEKGGFAVMHLRVDGAAAMRDALRQQAWDLVLSDFNIPGFGAADALTLLRQTGLDIPFIVVSELIDETSAVMLMRSGAHDYLKKDDLARLVPAVRRELDEARGRAARRQAESDLRDSEARLRGILHNMQDVFFPGRSGGPICFPESVGSTRVWL